MKYHYASFSTDPIKEAPATIHDAWKFCKDHSRSVEVFYKNVDGDKVLTRVHFQFDPEVSTVCVLLICMCCIGCMHVDMCVLSCVHTQIPMHSAQVNVLSIPPKKGATRGYQAAEGSMLMHPLWPHMSPPS